MRVMMMRRHAAHWARWVEGGHRVERGNHGRGQEGRRWERGRRRRRAGQVYPFKDCLPHLLHFGHQLLLRTQLDIVNLVRLIVW